MKELNWFEKLWIKLFDKSWLNFDEKFPEVGDNVELLLIFRRGDAIIPEDGHTRMFKSYEPFKWVIANKEEWVPLFDSDTKWRIKK